MVRSLNAKEGSSDRSGGWAKTGTFLGLWCPAALPGVRRDVLCVPHWGAGVGTKDTTSVEDALLSRNLERRKAYSFSKIKEIQELLRCIRISGTSGTSPEWSHDLLQDDGLSNWCHVRCLWPNFREDLWKIWARFSLGPLWPLGVPLWTVFAALTCLWSSSVSAAVANLCLCQPGCSFILSRFFLLSFYTSCNTG